MGKFVKLATTDEMANQPARCIEVEGQKIALLKEQRRVLRDAWLPSSFFVFGLDDAEGRPESLVPLVHIRSWALGTLSTDDAEGEESVTLPLV